jgi:hypothetical protein
VVTQLFDVGSGQAFPEMISQKTLIAKKYNNEEAYRFHWIA